MGRLYYLDNSRTDAQRREMQDLEDRGVCVFCPEHLENHPSHEIILRTAHWNVTPNEFPYAGTRTHLLLVPAEHVTDLLDLSSEARLDMWEALRMVREQFGLTFYGLGARNGDFRYTGGTVAHVHVHLVVGDVHDPDHSPVRLKLSSRTRDVGTPAGEG